MIVEGMIGDRPFVLTVETGRIQAACGPAGVEVASRLAAAEGLRVEVPMMGQLRVRRRDPASALAWLNQERDIRLEHVHDAPVLAPPVPEGTTS